MRLRDTEGNVEWILEMNPPLAQRLGFSPSCNAEEQHCLWEEGWGSGSL